MYLDGVSFHELRSEYGLKDIARKLYTCIFRLIRQHGPSALEDRDGFNTYTNEFKEKGGQRVLRIENLLLYCNRKKIQNPLC